MLRITAVLNEENATVISERSMAEVAEKFCTHFTQYNARFEFKAYPDGKGGQRAYLDGGYVIELWDHDPETGIDFKQYAMIEDC